MSQFSSTSSGVGRTNYARPQATVPRAAPSAPTTVIYNPVYNSHPYGSGFGLHDVVTAYYLSRMVNDLSRPHGYYRASSHQAYVPNPDPNATYLTTTTSQPTSPTPVWNAIEEWSNLAQRQQDCMKRLGTNEFIPCLEGTMATKAPKARKINLCTLARWNREVPYGDLPNMAVQFLSDDTISGNTTQEKSRFVLSLFKDTTAGFDSYNSSADVFTLPPNSSGAVCNFPSAQGIDVTKSRNSSEEEEPILTSARNILATYSQISAESHFIADLVSAAKACLPRGQDDLYSEVVPCLTFSIDPQYLVSLRNPSSLFGNLEICGGPLNPDLFKCVPSDDTASCNLGHLVALNLFARNFYLCSEDVDSGTVTKILDAITDAREMASAAALDALNSGERIWKRRNFCGFMPILVIFFKGGG